MTIKDKVIFIMGASSGIGEATTKLLAKKGAKLVIAARSEDKLKQLSTALAKDDIYYKKVDVTNYDEVQEAIDLTIEKFGRIDVLFNNAGVMPTNPLIAGQRDEWKQMLDINVMGVLNGIAATLPIMVKQQKGHIISTDSIAGHKIYPNAVVYGATKFAVRAIMEGLRQEHLSDNIKSTIISPGNVTTELYKTINDKKAREDEFNLRNETELLTAEDIASAVAYAIDTPERMSVNEMVVRPTQQER